MTPQALIEWARQAAKVEFGDDDPMVRLIRSLADLIESQQAEIERLRGDTTFLDAIAERDAKLTAIRRVFTGGLADDDPGIDEWEAGDRWKALTEIWRILDGTAERPQEVDHE